MARIVDRNIEALLARRQQEKKLEVFRIASPIKLPSLRQHVVCLPPSIRVRAMDRAQYRMVSAIRVRSHVRYLGYICVCRGDFSFDLRADHPE
jgi:hypothetical protein